MALPLTINTQLPPPSTHPHQTLPPFLRPLRFPSVLRPHKAAAPLPFTYSSSFLLSISQALSLSTLPSFKPNLPPPPLFFDFSGGLATDLRCSGSPRTEPSLLPYSFLKPDGQTLPHASSFSSPPSLSAASPAADDEVRKFLHVPLFSQTLTSLHVGFLIVSCSFEFLF